MELLGIYSFELYLNVRISPSTIQRMISNITFYLLAVKFNSYSYLLIMLYGIVFYNTN